ncbi:hypothetical protein [Streptococcus sp. sy004]|uniref:hypothetical protein n=1 Tax=Streptococcus sp. sy004 TaxID=2600149 RepID=UPI0011B5CF61|nr:hypothetical protein [Streptococcus sp. sy004]TWT12057.1 hypothetical protein FRX54_00545 [Streptococcus sp. sy004]
MFFTLSYRKTFIGSFDKIGDAIDKLKQHQESYSAISSPRFRKSRSGEIIRIDYGSSDCYYLIEKGERDDRTIN